MHRLTGILGLMILLAPAIGQNLNGGRRAQGHDEVVRGVVVVKLAYAAGNLRATGDAPLNIIQNSFSSKDIEAVLPPSKSGRSAPTKSGLERIYKITFEKDEDIFELARQIEALDGVEYAEPLYENVPLYITNDPHSNPNSGSQYHLGKIKAYEAWEVEKGDTSVVVAIVDTGSDIDHSDLFPNAFINYNDPLNGIDDDQDGYVDNHHGWDIADSDNDPNVGSNGHGVMVAGISSAKANNGLGVAGVGFNTRFLPVKVMANASGKLKDEYAGVIYAANHGAKVINLSWGSAWGYSQFAQDVINYAVLDRDIVVVAAAGNTHGHIDFYPASFDNVLSVAASDENDNLADWATYSYRIDLMAPGQSIFSTKNGNNYGSTGNGTSFSAPMVAGAAALVRSKYPHLDARQVMEQVRVTADDVYGKGSNSRFWGKIGKGRLNVHRALVDTTRPSVRLKDFSYMGSYGQHIFPGDTIQITPVFINYLSEAKSLKITIAPADSNTLYTEKPYQISSLNTYQTKSMLEDAMEVVISPDLLPGTRAYFRIDYETADFSDFEYFYITTTPHFFDIENNELSTTVCSDGDIGYDRDSYNWGKGMWLGFEKISGNMGLIVSRNENYVADNVVSDYSIRTKDKDFVPVEYARMYNNSSADVDARSAFAESDDVVKQGLKIEQKVLGWNDHAENNFFVLEYRLVNSSDSTLNGLNAAFFADYDLKDKNANAAGYDAVTGLAYTYDKVDSELFAGLALLTPGDATAYSFDIASHGGNTADFDTTFPDSLKYNYSVSNFDKVQAGVNGAGNNVANLAGLKNIELKAGESKKVAFVVMAGPSLDNLKEQLGRAKSKYSEYLDNPPIAYQVSSCWGDAAEIRPEKGESFEVYKDVALAQRLDSGTVYNMPSIQADTAYYVVNIAEGIREDVNRAVVVLKDPVAGFTPSQDSLFISEETLDTVRFINKTINANQYTWDFGNGYFSNAAQPVALYNKPGNFVVQLIARSSLGCSDTLAQPFVVVETSPRPAVKDLVLCRGEQAFISAANTQKIRVYADEELKILLFEGNEYTSKALWKSEVFYVTNVESYESLPAKVAVTVSSPKADFEYSIAFRGNNRLLKVETSCVNAEALRWKINDEFVSDEEVVYYDYSADKPIDINLSAYDSISCEDSRVLSLTPTKSPVPNVEDVVVCAGGMVDIKPNGGKNFFFYADSMKANFLGAGAMLTVGPVEKDTTLYVTSIDSLIESEAVAVNIKMSSFTAGIAVSADTINLSDTNSIEIDNTSIGAGFTYFLWPSGAIDTTKHITQTVTAPGTYAFRIVAENDDNCIDTATALVYVYTVTATEAAEDQGLKQEVQLFPNPANDRINIAFNGNYTYNAIEIVDRSGRVIFNKNLMNGSFYDLEIDTSHLSNGIYLVRLHRKNNVELLKLAIRR